MHFQGIRALAAASGADRTVGVMCTLRDAQATEKAAQLGLFLMCRLRSEKFQPIAFSKSPPDMGPSDTNPPVQLISGQMPTRPGVFDHDRGSMILCVSD